MANLRKNGRKVFATSVSAAMVASAVAPAVVSADHQFTDVSSDHPYHDEIKAMVEAGVVTGYPDGTFKLGEQVARKEAAVVMAGMLDLEASADTELPFTDVEADAWYTNAVKAVYEAGVMVGQEDDEFAPDAQMTRKELAQMIYAAYELDASPETELPFTDVEEGVWYEEALKALYANGLISGQTETTFGPDADMKRGDFAYLTAQTDFALGSKLEKPAPEMAMVEEVSATNLKEVTVEFNTNVEGNEDVADKANYSFENTAIASVSVDGNMVTIALDSAVSQQTEETLTVSEDILAEEGTFDVSFFDTTVPTADSAENVGAKQVKVHFSEPIDASAFSQLSTSDQRDIFELVGENIYVDDVTFSNNNKEAVVSFFSDLEDGDYELKVNGGILVDYAGYTVTETSLDVTVEADTEAPALVDYKDANQRTVTLVFDEPIAVEDWDESAFYHTNSKNSASLVKAGEKDNELVVEFDNNHLPAGTAYVYVDGEAVTDLWGNENENQLDIVVEVDTDEEAPQVSEVKLGDAQNELVVTYDEVVDQTTALDKDNYAVLNADGDEVVIAGTGINPDGNKVTLTLASNLSGDATLKADGIEDLVGNSLDEFETDFYAEDVTAPSGFSATYYPDKNGAGVHSLIVDYGEAMMTEGGYSVLDIEKYLVNSEDLVDYSGYVSLNAIDGDSKVEIVYDYASHNEDDSSSANANLFATGTNNIKVARVADNSGNTTDNLTTTFDITLQSDFGAVKQVATSKTTLDVTLEEALVDYDRDDFALVTTGGYTLKDSEILNVELSSGGKVLTFTLHPDSALTTDALYNNNGSLEQINVNTTETSTQDVVAVNQFGDHLDINSALVTDGISPTVVTDAETRVDTDANHSNVTLNFTENVESSIAGATGDNFVVTDEDGQEYTFAGTTGTPSEENTFTVHIPSTSDSSNTVTVYVYGKDVKTKELYIDFSDANYFTDEATPANEVEDFSVTVEVYGN
ncbi:S-layer homology domain-containing protein [Filobacillus milosensis]|uniref:S-layer homology domain-containing protein n=1 Tax=Filobacillus milosensis TaxID=94137 RepID=A0A4Y8IJJ0_9BACI|nr:S-layer homology domain-containing protein [Filobacillus milosensis]TFB19288.1 S-layer homology domain-containing protein [Filobacillus milosensis]